MYPLIWGVNGKPGASVRSFRDFCKNAMVYGADIDTRVFFSEERIVCHPVDQHDTDSLIRLGQAIPQELDLIIEDGLHNPIANLNSFDYLLPKVKIGGWIVIEDIEFAELELWQIVASLLPSNYQPYIIDATPSLLFAVQRLQ